MLGRVKIGGDFLVSIFRIREERRVLNCYFLRGGLGFLKVIFFSVKSCCGCKGPGQKLWRRNSKENEEATVSCD